MNKTIDNNCAERIISALRLGIPPHNHVINFTVGRSQEIDRLKNILKKGENSALLLLANYGSGKTHLLKLIREMALQENYAVSLIALDAKAAIKFNKMDQIFGTICRYIEIPNIENKGINYFFDFIVNIFKSLIKGDNIEQFGVSYTDIKSKIYKISNNFKWNHCSFLSPAIYIALRAWFFGDTNTQNLTKDWLFNPWNYSNNASQKLLYSKLVKNLKNNFKDSRREWQFYEDDVFVFDKQGYQQSWDALNDLDKLSKIIGLRGLILLIDEYEDVIHNLNNIKHQQSAFWNLFQFFSGEKFNNLAFFAVTPDFEHNCKTLLYEKNIWDYDYSRFDELDKFELSHLSEEQLIDLGDKIADLHFKAYNWNMDKQSINSKIKNLCKDFMKISIQDRVRHSIKKIITMLDEFVED